MLVSTNKIYTRTSELQDADNIVFFDETLFRTICLQSRFFSNLSTPLRQACGTFSLPNFRLLQLNWLFKSVINDFSNSDKKYDFSFMFCNVPIKTSKEDILECDLVCEQIALYTDEISIFLAVVKEIYGRDSRTSIKLAGIHELLILLNNNLLKRFSLEPNAHSLKSVRFP